MSNILAVDIGGTHFRIGLFSGEGRRLLVSEGDTDASAGREWMLERLRERGRAILADAPGPAKACGVSFGGPVDFLRQQVSSLHACGWKDFPLALWLKETFHLPCRLDNDANAGALGEYHYGAGRGKASMVYVTISTGVGSGVICEGKLLHGKDGMAGELGHVPVADCGELCSCGNRGCLETFCSGRAIESRAQEWAARRPERVGRMSELSGHGEITARAVLTAAAEGDTAAGNIVQEVARRLARGLLVVIRLLNPELIVLGGGVAQAGATLLDPVRESLEELGSPTVRHSTKVVLTELGNESPLYGAAVLGREAAEEPGSVTC
jgi:glucokinase